VLRISRLEPSRRRDDGTSAVEFALVLIPLITLVLGILQYGWYFYSSQLGASTAREAVRRLAVGDCTAGTELQAFVDSRLGGASESAAMITTAYQTALGSDIDLAAGEDIEIGGKVSVTIAFQSLDLNFPFIPVPDNAMITREVDARVEDTNSSGCP
jgi:Flp pilus assembly protein TadG